MTDALDLEEGKRLLSEASLPLASLNPPYPYDPGWNEDLRDAYDAAMAQRRGIFEARDRYNDWLRSHAASLIAAAEEAEKLRELLREARPWVDQALEDQPLGATSRMGISVLRRIDAALTPPEQGTPK